MVKKMEKYSYVDMFRKKMNSPLTFAMKVISTYYIATSYGAHHSFVWIGCLVYVALGGEQKEV